MNEKNAVQLSHSFRIHERKSAFFTGITEVTGFDDQSVVLESVLGGLSIEGRELKIESFSAESGELSLVGTIDGLFYFSAGGEKKGGLFRRKNK